MEKETNLYKRVGLFFLVDSITQCSCNQKGGTGDVFPSVIQAVLPRLLYAAAPPGNSAWENRRQCLKVLKLWLERKTLPEYIIRHHIRELEVINDASFGSSRRPSRTERALNDPLRDNEGMLVDEYGSSIFCSWLPLVPLVYVLFIIFLSNAGFHIPNLICTKVLEDDEGSSSEDISFEAVTPEHEAPGVDEKGESQIPVEKHGLILEDVDGELEMEDVAPSSEAEASTRSQPERSDTNCTPSYHHPSDNGPPLLNNWPPSPPPLPSSPPPVPVAQRTQLQATSQMASDPVGPYPALATYNVQSQQPHSTMEHPRSMNPSVAPLQPPSFCNSGYGVHRNQIAPLNPTGPHGNFATPPAPYHGNNYHQRLTASMPNEGYHMQRPPPPPPSQFPHMPSEPNKRPQQWSNNSLSYPESHRYNGHDRDHHRHDNMHHGYDRRHHLNDRGYRHDERGHHFDERAIRGPMLHDPDRGRFPPFPPVFYLNFRVVEVSLESLTSINKYLNDQIDHLLQTILKHLQRQCNMDVHQILRQVGGLWILKFLMSQEVCYYSSCTVLFSVVSCIYLPDRLYYYKSSCLENPIPVP
ncbi:protein HUA2-LIKE 2 isoform X3 [Triticum aestivum]|uniref:protein HUA2-LIKE 2 isoform X3 n=1 Tax=Triticum aestivum TaxID=4565 RepID=UPI001D0060F1|nr:protein HUA2-LIKE 2-like isoform X3 [Triticum aestivum]XP_044375110.1 protein HUA2-LIKE 2-like isoform X3 [Triticum aestivum]